MKFGIVGTNFVSDFFMKSAASVPEISVSAVVSGHRQHAEEFAAKYQIPNVYENLEELLNSGTVDAVYLAVPNHLHYQMTLECLRHHMPVMTEKPFAPTLAQAQEMMKTAEETGTYVHDASIPLYTDHLQLLKQSLGKIGRIRRAVISYSKYSSRYDAYLAGKNPTTFRREMCNGSWMDLGIYCLSDCIALLGKPKTISASATLLETGADCQGSAVFGYDGFDAILLHSKVADTKIISEIEGEDGTLQFDVPSQLNQIWFTDRRTKTTVQLGDTCTVSWACQLHDFVNSWQKHLPESERVPHSLTLDIIEVLEECRKQSGVIYPCDEE